MVMFKMDVRIADELVRIWATARNHVLDKGMKGGVDEIFLTIGLVDQLLSV